MHNKKSNRRTEALRKRRQRIILAAAVATTLCAVVLAFIVIPHVRDLRAIRRELASLPNLSPFDVYWQEANPNYVGWLRIDGTNVDFPVVRGTDNVRYARTRRTNPLCTRNHRTRRSGLDNHQDGINSTLVS